jgi:polyisoprenoid-binding protein YceI
MGSPCAARAVVVALLVTGCAQQGQQAVREPQATTVSQSPRSYRGYWYEQASAQGKSVYRVDPASSLVYVTVRRAGSLARLGHDHVVASHQVQGFVAPQEGRADLYVRLADLVVDEQALRLRAGLDTFPSEADIAGTRSNMLDKVLQVQLFPDAVISVHADENLPPGARLTVAFTLHGVTRTFDVPAQVQDPSDQMTVSGQFEFNQSDFGIQPFSILGGAIQVQDRLTLSFSIYARRDSAPANSPR